MGRYQSDQQGPVDLPITTFRHRVTLRQKLDTVLRTFCCKIAVHNGFNVRQIQLRVSVFSGIGSHILLEHLHGHRPERILECILGRCGIHIGGVHHFIEISLKHANNICAADVHAKSGRNRIGIHRDHIPKVQLLLLLLIEARSGEHIGFRIRKLLLHKLRFGRQLDHMTGQIGGVCNTG